MKQLILIVAATAFLTAACWASAEPQHSAVTNNATLQRPAKPGLLSRKTTLVGITTLSDKKTAFLKTEAADKSAKPAQIQRLALSEHQRSGDIEVLEIDETSGSVRVRIAGVEKLLKLESDLPAGTHVDRH